MDQYCTLLLLWLFSPAVDSLRGFATHGQLNKVQRSLTFRELRSVRSRNVCEFLTPAVKKVVYELADRCRSLRSPSGCLSCARPCGSRWHRGQDIDASSSTGLGSTVLLWLPTPYSVQVLRGLPSVSTLQEPTQGPKCRTAVLEQTIEPQHCYVMDRGFEKYQLWNRIHVHKAIRVSRPMLQVETLQELPLTQADKQAGVTK